MRLLQLESEGSVYQVPTDHISRASHEENFEAHIYITRQHRKLVESFCSLLLRCTSRRSMEDQIGFTEIISSNLHQLQRRLPFSSSLDTREHISTSWRLLTDWAKRRSVQLRFFLRSESVNHMHYRKQILMNELPLDTNGSILCESLHIEAAEWIGNTNGVASTIEEEAKARRMVNCYQLSHREAASVHTPRGERLIYGSTLIDEHTVNLTKKALTLFL
uniref:Uncharacterized protein n=1 Tax=Paramoeba aestuarina TaxID=180227 RepID=A0A7S4P354_9EUKA|mmetsp:Transcript_35535/g.55432  ORF Transcript_35535/g.55432 Transcript_35535/m.55432 type:complete len:219 (+) Transcript_35535:161-817(+)